MLDHKLLDMFCTIWGEVAQQDCYRLRKLPWVPNFIIDIGANVGAFAVWAKLNFPESRVLAIEPDGHNYTALRDNIRCLSALVESCRGALGRDQVWQAHTTETGGNQSFVSSGLGYPNLSQATSDSYTISAVQVVTLKTLFEYFFSGLDDGRKVILKIDCEGGENCIFDDPESMEALRRADYIAMELHYHCDNGSLLEETRRVTDEALESLKSTHDCEREKNMFWALKREADGN